MKITDSKLHARLTRYGWIGFVNGRIATAPCISFGEALKAAAEKEEDGP